VGLFFLGQHSLFGQGHSLFRIKKIIIWGPLKKNPTEIWEALYSAIFFNGKGDILQRRKILRRTEHQFKVLK
jgi:hypothetical protein